MPIYLNRTILTEEMDINLSQGGVNQEYQDNNKDGGINRAV